MGGHGSGRKPDPAKQFRQAQTEQRATISQEMFLPNYSAIKRALSTGPQEFALTRTIDFTQQSTTGDGTTTMDWRLGNKFFFTFGAFNETFTFTAPSNPCNILLVLKQDGTGSRTATWPVAVKWPGGTAPTLSTGANKIDIISFYFDGTSYYGVDSLDFS